MKSGVINPGVFDGGVDGDDNLARNLLRTYPKIVIPERQHIRRMIFIKVFFIQKFNAGIRDENNRKLTRANSFMTQDYPGGFEDWLDFEWNSFLQVYHCYGRWHFSSRGI